MLETNRYSYTDLDEEYYALIGKEMQYFLSYSMNEIYPFAIEVSSYSSHRCYWRRVDSLELDNQGHVFSKKRKK